MDNNLPTNPTNQINQGQPERLAPTQPVPPMAQQPQAQMPQLPDTQAAQQPPVVGTAPEKKGMKNTFLLIVFLILSVIIALFVYILFTNITNKQSNLPSTTPLVASPTTVVPRQTLQQEVESVDVGNVDEDLRDIDADLQGL